MDNEAFAQFPFALLKSMCLNPHAEFKILEHLMDLLRDYDKHESYKPDDFPCS